MYPIFHLLKWDYTPLAGQSLYAMLLGTLSVLDVLYYNSEQSPCPSRVFVIASVFAVSQAWMSVQKLCRSSTTAPWHYWVGTLLHEESSFLQPTRTNLTYVAWLYFSYSPMVTHLPSSTPQTELQFAKRFGNLPSSSLCKLGAASSRSNC